MKKLFKILIYLTISVVLLVVVAVVAVSVFVDPNDYRDQIAEVVHDKTGRTLDIKGDLSLSVFPWIGLSIGESTLSNAKGFGDQPFARFDEIDIKIKLMPLLSSEVEMDTITLDGVKVNLAKNKKGVSNWDDLSKGAKKPEEKDSDKGKGEGPKSVKIGGVKINNARFTWEDKQAGTSYVIDNLGLQTGALEPGKPVDLELAFDIKDEKADKSWQFGLDGLLALDAEKQTGSFTNIVLQLGNLKLKGNINITNMMTDPVIKASLKSDAFVPRETFTEFGLPLPNVSDATVFGKAQLELALTATSSKVNVSKLVMKLDDTTMSGTASVSNFGKPAIRYNISVDDIDVDRYLPPASKEKPADKPEQATSDKIDLPVEMMRALNIKGTFKIGKLKVSNLRSQEVNMVLTAKNGLIKINPATAKMYGGSYSGNIGVDVRGKQLVISMDETLQKVQANPLFKDLADMDWIEGGANLSAKLTGKGNSVSAIKSSLNGNIKFAFLDGAIKGVNIPLKIRQAYATIKGQPAPPDEAQKTDFASITGSAVVTNGVIDNRDFDMQSPLLRVQGAGKVDLGKENIDYLVKAKVVASLEGQEGDSLQKLKGVTIPVRIKGPFTKLSYKVELEDVVKDEVKKKVKKKLENKLKDKFKGLF